jgi:hypothetical protein
MQVTTETDIPATAPVTARNERAQLAFAGLLWAAGATILSVRGVGWLLAVDYAVVLIAGGIVLGVLKARFVLDPVARKAAARIRERGPRAPVLGFFSVRSWATVLSMVALGHLLRLTALPRPVLGVVYVAVATALVVASRVFWRFHTRGWAPEP